LRQRGIQIIRDKRDLGDKGSIAEFMARNEQGDCMIAVISDKYLRSANCMVDLLEIAENKQFHDRFFPVILPDANIFDPLGRIDYIKYWESKRAELTKAMKMVDLANLQGLRMDLDLYDRIRDMISGLTNILKDTNSLVAGVDEDLDSLYEAIMDVRRKPQAEAEAQPQTKAPAEPQTEPQPEPQTKPQAEPWVELQAEAQPEPEEAAAIDRAITYYTHSENFAELLSQGAQAWNQWRQENPTLIPLIPQLDMTTASFSEFDFSNVQFPGARITRSTFDEVNFSGARFLDSVIIGSSFTDTTLTRAIFENTQIIDSDFSGTNLSGSNWQDVELVGSSFLATELTGSRFTRVNMVSISFEKAHLEDSVFDHAKMTDVSFRSSDMQKAKFTAAELDKNVHFQEANLREIEFHDSDLPNVDFSYLKMRNAIFINTNLVNNKFHDADLASAVFEGVNLENANAKRAQLKNVRFDRSALDSANFSQADLRFARIKGSSLVNATFFSADLSKAMFSANKMQHCSITRAILQDADFRGSDLGEANLALSFMQRVNLAGCQLVKAILMGVDLGFSSLINCNLQNADLSQASLNNADLTESDLTGANLCRATLIDTTVEKATFSRCLVYGISAWNLAGIPAQQKDLIITPEGQNEITTDDVEIAQFFYLLLNNAKLRNVIDTVTSKTVLILGRFSPPERKAVLDALREELRKRNYIPIVFDFEAPRSRDLTETIRTLAHMSRFIIADLTDARSIPQELTAIVPNLPSVAVQPLILKGQREYAMFEHIARYPWVLPIYEYESQEQLLKNLVDKVVLPSEAKVKEISKEAG
jgi:uncharacterized protein YjbI with pentapeptide repeats